MDYEKLAALLFPEVTETPEDKPANSNIGWIIGVICGVVVIAGVIAAILIAKKAKKK